LSDEDFNEAILAGVLLRRPRLDLVRVREIGLAHTPDSEILAWAADHHRIVVTHNVSTMTANAHKRRNEDERMSGLVLVPQTLPLRDAIEDLVLMDACSSTSDWDGMITYLPLR
jgi:hypothetical protein